MQKGPQEARELEISSFLGHGGNTEGNSTRVPSSATQGPAVFSVIQLEAT